MLNDTVSAVTDPKTPGMIEFTGRQDTLCEVSAKYATMPLKQNIHICKTKV